MKAFSFTILIYTLMAVNSYAYIIVGKGPNSLIDEPSEDNEARPSEIDKDGMGPIIPKEIEQNRFPASIPTDEENGNTQDNKKKYKRPYK